MSDLHGNPDPRIAGILERGLYLFAGNEAVLQKWLKTPDPQLGGETPQEVIDGGRPEIVANLIEAALRGIPD
ncbi:MAG: DUF2384 domain-containing protein [Verrucomicrobia bacterium]|nr:DUF2384 domain-containing protein [Verrucomicrobiota bacterium]